MIYLEFDEQGKFKFAHHRPFDPEIGLGKTQEELKETGLLVENLPEFLTQEGKIPVLCLNFETNELFYDYVERDLTTDEELKSVKDRLALSESAIDFLIMNGGM